MSDLEDEPAEPEALTPAVREQVKEIVDEQVERLKPGVIPGPDEVSAYARFVPDAPERFIAYIEREQAHRHSLEKKDVEDRDERRTAEMEVIRSEAQSVQSEREKRRKAVERLGWGVLVSWCGIVILLAVLDAFPEAVIIGGLGLAAFTAVSVAMRVIGQHREK